MSKVTKFEFMGRIVSAKEWGMKDMKKWTYGSQFLCFV